MTKSEHRLWSRDRLDSFSGEIQISVQGATIIYPWCSDLAKLNLKCHMNYLIIFTEISFYPETSNLMTEILEQLWFSMCH